MSIVAQAADLCRLPITLLLIERHSGTSITKIASPSIDRLVDAFTKKVAL